jgi:CxxC motif-containing protein (DUF1111 family)
LNNLSTLLPPGFQEYFDMSFRCFVIGDACLRTGTAALALLAACLVPGMTAAQTAASQDAIRQPKVFDPGPRPVGNQGFSVTGAILKTGAFDAIQPQDDEGNGAGRQLAKLTPDQTGFWFASLAVFGQKATADGAIDPGTGNPTILGLGPAFNGDSCVMCHSFPTIGGTSPPINPQVAVATDRGGENKLPPFITPNGPVREARFVHGTGDGLPGGAVRPLFTIAGRSDAPAGCSLAQPDFHAELGRNNVVLRIPTPTYGLGFVENTPDGTLRQSFEASAYERERLGIRGHFNTNGNDQTITRFGWKAQNKSLLLFSGEAANVELGLSNELFPNERIVVTDCNSHELPEDTANIVSPALLAEASPGEAASLEASDIVNFGVFMRLNAAPSQCAFDSGVDGTGAARCVPLDGGKNAASITNGHQEFKSVGCSACHTETLTTGPSPFESLNNATYHPYSDFALHDMGTNLADGVVQGSADGDEFRTAPLWGLGQRLFFLHDGRTGDLLEAILAHKSPGSEADAVVRNFLALGNRDKQDLLNYLRSL